MKTLFHLFLFIILSHIASTNASMSFTPTTPQAPTNEPITLNSMVRDIMFADTEESQKVFNQIQQSAKSLESSVAQTAQEIKQLNAQRNKGLQQLAEQESRIIFDKYTQEASQLNQETNKQLIKLKQDAAEQLLSLINQAEEEARRAKYQTRKEILEKKLFDLEKSGSLATWKEQLRQDFSNNTEYLKNIIFQGETPDQAQDFMKRFDEQATWFDKTLSSTQYQTDPSYYQLSQKKIALDNVVASHRASEILLKERLRVLGKELQNPARARLMLLYDINNLISKKSGDGIATIAAAILSPQETNDIVDNAIQSAELKFYQPTTPVNTEEIKQPSSQKDKDLLSLTTELENTKRLLAKESKAKMELKNFAQQKIELGASSNFDLEAQLKHTQSKFDREKQKAKQAQTQQQQLKQRVKPKLERLAKENFELQTIILDTNQKLSDSQKKLATIDQTIDELQKNIQQQKKRTYDIEARVGLIDELADKRAHEYRLQFDIKRTLITEAENSPELNKQTKEKVNRLELEQELEERIIQTSKRQKNKIL